MIRKSRLLVALGLVAALGVSGIAFADGASDNTVNVRGNVAPKKLPKKKLRNVNLFVQVTTNHGKPIGEGRENVKAVFIDFGRNVRLVSNARPRCAANIQGTSTQQARQICPGRSNIGQGKAHIEVLVQVSEDPPVFVPLEFKDLIVTVFNGPARNQVRLHASSQTLGPGNTQVIQGFIRKAPGKRFGQRLAVPVIQPVAGGAGSILLFNATIGRRTGVAKARCGANRFLWRSRWVFEDNSSSTRTFSQRCTRPRR